MNNKWKLKGRRLQCLIFIFLSGFFSSLIYAEDQSWKYLGQEPPGNTPVVFAPGIISGKGNLHCFPSFSSDGKEIVWMTLPPKLFYVNYDVKWSEPQEILFSNDYKCMFPVFSYDNKRLYFASNNIPGGYGNIDIWYVEKTDTGYSKPINIGSPINTGQIETQPVFTESGNIYFTGYVKGKRWDRGILYAEYKNGKYLTPKITGEPINIINSTAVDYTPFIARDETYLLFSSNRHKITEEDCRIYISFRDTSANWTDPINLSSKIGFNEDSRDPYVSPDQKYLFFCSGENIYWVDAKIIEKLREQRQVQSVDLHPSNNFHMNETERGTLQNKNTEDQSWQYLGQKPLGNSPVVFTRRIISTSDQEHGFPAFSPDGSEIFWQVNRKTGPGDRDWQVSGGRNEESYSNKTVSEQKAAIANLGRGDLRFEISEAPPDKAGS